MGICGKARERERSIAVSRRQAREEQKKEERRLKGGRKNTEQGETPVQGRCPLT